MVMMKKKGALVGGMKEEGGGAHGEACRRQGGRLGWLWRAGGLKEKEEEEKEKK